jgi:hypothetical protein
MSNSEKFRLIILYLFGLSAFLITLVQFLAQFWIWSDLRFTLENELISGRLYISEGEAIKIASEINRENFMFFMAQVFPIVFLNVVNLLFLELVKYKIRKFQKILHDNIRIIDKLEFLRRAILKITSFYAIISWLLIPMNMPHMVLALLTYISLIRLASIPYFYIYFILLTSISLLSYLRTDELYFEDTLLEKVGVYKNLSPFISPFR